MVAAIAFDIPRTDEANEAKGKKMEIL